MKNYSPTVCRRCDGMLGPLLKPEDLTRHAHKLCATLTPQDWRALEPWFKGTLASVHMGGE
jgi:hypothetical protein